MQPINSIAAQLREYATIYDLKQEGIARLLRVAANDLDELHSNIEGLLDAEAKGRGTNFDQYLNKLANMIDYQGA